MSPKGKLALPAILLLACLCAQASEKATIRIKILDSESHSLPSEDNGVPKNCDGVNYDAYCRSSTADTVINTLLVQQGNEAPFRITCRVDTRWSRCTHLEAGESFDARKEKRGLTLYFVDDKGAVRKQLYTYVAEDSGRPAAIPAAAKIPLTANVTPAANAPESPPASAPAAGTRQQDPPPAQVPQAQVSQAGVPKEVKCSFSSRPPGADISLDGRYVGSTPSVMNLAVGPHQVSVSMPGFAPWKRALTVSSGSELTVNAVLEKAQ
jgi:hypothetical protein